MKKSKNKKGLTVYILVALLITGIIICGYVVYSLTRPPDYTNGGQPHVCKSYQAKEICTKDLVGLTEEDAINKVSDSDIWEARVVERDGNNVTNNGVQLPSENRVNLKVSQGKVTGVAFY